MTISDAIIVEETKKETIHPRKSEEITAEYAQIAFTAGDFSFKIACLKQDLDRLYYKMQELNNEAKASGMPKVPV